ncbi:hypothetical protein J2Y69_001282 [Microbacterium resistens]|uniref:Integral membrane protein n=1 Tax=Microbacterium resistens TaxID=156977 RepID=A0ABU1SAV2_9MICO|nr:hypothetical protein [Microbacterium resistens]MDR6866689.1 hypothetical protein [Microbacterium resistens]
MERTRAIRAARGAIAATLATFVALLSHVGGGGAMPGWLGVVVPWVFSILVCVPLAGRRLSAVRLGIGVALSQALFHVLFVLGAGSSAGLVGVGHHGMIALPADSVSTTASTTVPASLTAPVSLEGLLWGDAAMWTAHVLAAVLTIAALHRGESAVRRLLTLAAETGSWIERQVLAIVRAFAGPLLVAGPRRLFDAETAVPRVLRAAHLSIVVRRGPPPASV